MKEMTHTIIQEYREDFKGFTGKKQKKVKCRLLKHTIVLEYNLRYKKTNGFRTEAHRYKGVYMENTIVHIDTLQEIGMQK